MPKLMQNGVDYTRPTHIMNKVINNYGSTNEETIKEVSSLVMNNRTLLVEKAVVVIEGEEYDSLEAFVESTDTEGEEANANGKFVIFTDTAGWGPLGVANTEYKGTVIYQNYYDETSTLSVNGCLLLYDSDGAIYKGIITGNKAGDNFDGVSINWTKIPSSEDLDELKKSVSDGKTLVADAITAKGIETATNATFATMAANIASIVAGEIGSEDSTTLISDQYIALSSQSADNCLSYTVEDDGYYLIIAAYTGRGGNVNYATLSVTVNGEEITDYEIDRAESGTHTNTKLKVFGTELNIGDKIDYSFTSTWGGDTKNECYLSVFNINKVSGGGSNINYIAPIYNSTQTYNEGDYVTYEDYMYECLEDGITGEFDSSKWDRTYLSESSLKEEEDINLTNTVIPMGNYNISYESLKEWGSAYTSQTRTYKIPNGTFLLLVTAITANQYNANSTATFTFEYDGNYEEISAIDLDGTVNGLFCNSFYRLYRVKSDGSNIVNVQLYSIMQCKNICIGLFGDAPSLVEKNISNNPSKSWSSSHINISNEINLSNVPCIAIVWNIGANQISSGGSYSTSNSHDNLAINVLSKFEDTVKNGSGSSSCQTYQSLQIYLVDKEQNLTASVYGPNMYLENCIILYSI